MIKEFLAIVAALSIAIVSISTLWTVQTETDRDRIIAVQQEKAVLHLDHVHGLQAREKLEGMIHRAKQNNPRHQKARVHIRADRQRAYIQEITEHARHAYHRNYYTAVQQPYINKTSSTILFVYSTISEQGASTRQAIRETWANQQLLNKNRISLSFVLAVPKDQAYNKQLNQFNKKQKHFDIEREQRENRDILMFNFVDSYRNLTLKTASILRWFQNAPHSANTLIKCDSDVFLNLDNLMKLIDETYKLHHTFILGHSFTGLTPNHDMSSKWFVPVTLYKQYYYPLFVSGTSYVISKSAVELLTHQISNVAYLYLEDVFVTGLCREKTNITLVHSDKFVIEEPEFMPDIWYNSVSVHGYSGIGRKIRLQWNGVS